MEEYPWWRQPCQSSQTPWGHVYLPADGEPFSTPFHEAPFEFECPFELNVCHFYNIIHHYHRQPTPPPHRTSSGPSHRCRTRSTVSVGKWDAVLHDSGSNQVRWCLQIHYYCAAWLTWLALIRTVAWLPEDIGFLDDLSSKWPFWRVFIFSMISIWDHTMFDNGWHLLRFLCAIGIKLTKGLVERYRHRKHLKTLSILVLNRWWLLFIFSNLSIYFSSLFPYQLYIFSQHSHISIVLFVHR